MRAYGKCSPILAVPPSRNNLFTKKPNIMLYIQKTALKEERFCIYRGVASECDSMILDYNLLISRLSSNSLEVTYVSILRNRTSDF
jgi:hypothetical protein